MKILRNLSIILLTIFVVQSGKAQSSAMKEPVKFKLKNGMNVIVAENLSSAKIYASFVIDAEPVVEGNKPGVQNLLNAMLNEMVGETKAGVKFNENGGNVAASTADFDNLLSVLSVSVQEPILSQSSFEKAKTSLMASVQAKDHYYPDSVTEQALQKITLNDVAAFYSKHITPSRAYLTIVGHVTVDEAKALVKRTFGNWDESPLYTSSK